MKKKNGEIVTKQKFNKCSTRWTVYHAKVPKTYPHIPAILRTIMEKYDKNDSNTKSISKTIAPVPAPKKADLIAMQKSRFTT